MNCSHYQAVHIVHPTVRSFSKLLQDSIDRVNLKINQVFPFFNPFFKQQLIIGFHKLEANIFFFIYLWSNGGTQASVGGLSLGNYNCIVTDANGCRDTLYFIIIGPATALFVNGYGITNVSCNGYTDGVITANVTGGVMPYLYSIDNAPLQTSNTFANLSANSYLITVEDANGCIIPNTVNITEPDPLLLTLTPTNVSCFGFGNGEVDASVTGGTIPYNFIWSNGAISEDIINLTVGIYQLTLTDTNGCSPLWPGGIVNDNVAIMQPSELQMLVVSVVDPLCHNDTNGSITIDLLGGTT